MEILPQDSWVSLRCWPVTSSHSRDGGRLYRGSERRIRESGEVSRRVFVHTAIAWSTFSQSNLWKGTHWLYSRMRLELTM